MMNIYLVHNNWFLGEHLKLDQCDHCQWLNCARGETLGNQVGTQLIIAKVCFAQRSTSRLALGSPGCSFGRSVVTMPKISLKPL